MVNDKRKLALDVTVIDILTTNMYFKQNYIVACTSMNDSEIYQMWTWFHTLYLLSYDELLYHIPFGID